MANPLAVLDGHFDPGLVSAAADAWPVGEDGWVAYDSPLERKRALHDWPMVPPPCRGLLAEMMLFPAAGFLGIGEPLLADASLYGAGLHEMGRGGHLAPHLDSDRHPHLGLERRANLILFLGEWRPEWGGHLELRDDPTAAVWRVPPGPGRLVMFATGDTSVHGVVGPLTCPPGVLRKSLALYFWGRPRGPSLRPRALFLPQPGEPPDPALDALRAARARPGAR